MQRDGENCTYAFNEKSLRVSGVAVRSAGTGKVTIALNCIQIVAAGTTLAFSRMLSDAKPKGLDGQATIHGDRSSNVTLTQKITDYSGQARVRIIFADDPNTRSPTFFSGVDVEFRVSDGKLWGSGAIV